MEPQAVACRLRPHAGRQELLDRLVGVDELDRKSVV
jgi:hypothetical protein